MASRIFIDRWHEDWKRRIKHRVIDKRKQGRIYEEGQLKQPFERVF